MEKMISDVITAGVWQLKRIRLTLNLVENYGHFFHA